MADPKFRVGQRVMMCGYHGGSRHPGVVTKVGRTLVTVERSDTGWPHAVVYRIESGKSNDAYGHQWVLTLAEQHEQERRQAVVARFGVLKVEVARCQLPLETLERMLAIAEESESAPTFRRCDHGVRMTVRCDACHAQGGLRQEGTVDRG